VASAIAPARFEALTTKPRMYTQRLRAVVLRTRLSGVVKGRPGEVMVRQLRSFRDVIWFAVPGAPIVPTRDLMTALGIVFLQSPDDSTLDADVDELRRFEDEELLVDVMGF